MFDTPLHNWRDILRLVTNAGVKARADIGAKKWKFIVALVAGFIALLLFGLSSAVLWLIFFSFLFYKWDDRILGTIAILFLIACPILSAFNLNAIEEQSAVFAFFFLVMTVALQIVEYKRNPNENAE